VAAAAPAVPQPLVAQLADGGRLVVPVAAGADRETLVRVRRRGSAIDVEDLGPCRFVPLIGEAGYARPGEEMGSPDGN